MTYANIFEENFEETYKDLTMKQPQEQIKQLIPDLLPEGHVPFNLKRIRFIKGHGAIIHNAQYAVEVYISYSNEKNDTFFAVHKHHGSMKDLRRQFHQLRFINVDDVYASDRMKRQFEEALFQQESCSQEESKWIFPQVILKSLHGKEAKEITLHPNLSGAA